MAIAAEREIDWTDVADRFCLAWTTDDGRPDFDTLRELYAPDDDVVIFDSLPPLEGFRGVDALEASIYDGLSRLTVHRTGPVEVRSLADGGVVVTSYLLRFTYAFEDGRRYDFDGRISQVWERRAIGYVIVHEHPSTVIADAS